MPPAKGPTVRETALAARVAELEAELRARDDFLAIAAHELRNPMTPISARLELLLARARQMSGGVPAGLVHGLELLEGLVNAYLRRATTLLVFCATLPQRQSDGERRSGTPAARNADLPPHSAHQLARYP